MSGRKEKSDYCLFLCFYIVFLGIKLNKAVERSDLTTAFAF